ncbi:hypothetical protein AXX17_AT1G11900 [Arabidopsis thaliana]|uniref:Pectinesterase n=1 Tax=Arabidopsis thaliana TaxID=3702 RepID=A0A178WLE5_ARATH|nr:hypothetical protein AXX17_AT1G11900 [Arabidopsis thaliana]
MITMVVIGVSKEYCDDKQSCQNFLLELKAGSSSLSEIRRRDLLIIVLKNSVRRIDMVMIGVMDDTKQHEEMENDLLGGEFPNRGSYENVHTWLSSVLTSYITCIDEIGEGAYKRRVEPKLEDLISRARIALALFISISPRDNTELISVIPNSPSWLFMLTRKIYISMLRIFSVSYKALEDCCVVVAKDGTGKYSTVNAAIAAAPQHSQKKFVIYIKTGIYDEIVVIENTKPNLTLIGDGQDLTIITGNLSASNVRRTFNTATVASNGNGFIGVDMCFRNTAGPAKGPAVALRVSGDMSVIYRCRVEGYQDALYPHSDRQFYRECFITGTVDFICGNAVAVFQFCQIVARQPKMGSDLDTTTVKTYLGRPWRIFSTVAVMQSFIGDLVDPAGWTPWEGETGLSTLHYREYQNRGPGAVTSRRVKWSGFKVMKNPKQATEFTVAKLLDGETWLKETRIPYESGL